MRLIGFSTDALMRGDFRAALQILEETHVHAVELSALRQNELIPLIQDLNDLDLREFQYKAFHAPSVMDRDFEPIAIDALHEVALREWPIIVIQMQCTIFRNGSISEISPASRTWTSENQ